MTKINVTGCEDCPFLIHDVSEIQSFTGILFACGLSGWLDSEEDIIGSELKTPDWCPLDKLLIGKEITNINTT